MKQILSLFVFLFTVNVWCQYEELNNAQWLSINNTKMIDLLKLNQNHLNNSKVVKVKILKNTEHLDSLVVLSIKVIDSIKTQVLGYHSMLNTTSEEKEVLQHHKKIKHYLHRFNKTIVAVVLDLNKEEKEPKKKTLVYLQKKQERYLIQLKKLTNNLERIYMFTLKGSRAY